MRNRESKFNSFSNLLTILLCFDSGLDSKKKGKIGKRTGIGIEKEFDTALICWHLLQLGKCFIDYVIVCQWSVRKGTSMPEKDKIPFWSPNVMLFVLASFLNFCQEWHQFS